MAGILTSGQKTRPPIQGGITDPALRKIEQSVDAKVPPAMKTMYLAIVVSGMKVMFDKSTAKYMQQHLQNSTDLVKTIGEDIPKLLILVYNESPVSKSKDQSAQAQFIGAAMLAGRTLMCQALDYAEKSGHIKVTTDIIDQCTTALNVSMPAAFGVTKDMMAQKLRGGQPQQATQPAAPVTSAPATPPAPAAAPAAQGV